MLKKLSLLMLVPILALSLVVTSCGGDDGVVHSFSLAGTLFENLGGSVNDPDHDELVYDPSEWVMIAAVSAPARLAQHNFRLEGLSVEQMTGWRAADALPGVSGSFTTMTDIIVLQNPSGTFGEAGFVPAVTLDLRNLVTLTNVPGHAYWIEIPTVGLVHDNVLGPAWRLYLHERITAIRPPTHGWAGFRLTLEDVHGYDVTFIRGSREVAVPINFLGDLVDALVADPPTPSMPTLPPNVTFPLAAELLDFVGSGSGLRGMWVGRAQNITAPSGRAAVDQPEENGADTLVGNLTLDSVVSTTGVVTVNYSDLEVDGNPAILGTDFNLAWTAGAQSGTGAVVDVVAEGILGEDITFTATPIGPIEGTIAPLTVTGVYQITLAATTVTGGATITLTPTPGDTFLQRGEDFLITVTAAGGSITELSFSGVASVVAQGGATLTPPVAGYEFLYVVTTADAAPSGVITITPAITDV